MWSGRSCWNVANTLGAPTSWSGSVFFDAFHASKLQMWTVKKGEEQPFLPVCHPFPRRRSSVTLCLVPGFVVKICLPYLFTAQVKRQYSESLLFEDHWDVGTEFNLLAYLFLRVSEPQEALQCPLQNGPTTVNGPAITSHIQIPAVTTFHLELGPLNPFFQTEPWADVET